MFNMKTIGATISRRRKELNMTQVELADQLLVSYQAVSQWELGKSMPELSNLTRLSEVLELPLEDLLGQSESTIVEKIQREESLDEEELVQGAPYIKPQELEEQLEGRAFAESTILALAPFLSSSALKDVVQASELSVESLVSLAPFLDEEDLGDFLDGLGDEAEMEVLVELAPFVSSESLASYIRRSGSKLDATDLVFIAPFLESHHLIEICSSEHSHVPEEDLILLAPFLDEEDLVDYLKKKPKNSSKKAHQGPSKGDTLGGLFSQIKELLKSDL